MQLTATSSPKRDRPGVVIVSVTGEIDAYTAPNVRSVLRTALAGPGLQKLQVDLAGVVFLDSSGINALVRCRNEAEARDIGLVVTNPQSKQAKVLDMVGLTEFLGVTYDDQIR